MYFPRPVRDDNGRNESGLRVPSTGCRRLDGDQALALARSRYLQYRDTSGRWHADPGTDLGRIRRQQTMLRALAANAVGRNLASPLRANALVGSVVHSLTRDDRLTIRRAVTLARQFRAFDPARLTTITLPVDRAVQRDGAVRRAGQPGFDAGLRQGWEQILLPRQPDATAAVARFLARPARPTPPAPAPAPRPPAPSQISVVVRNATGRQGLAARTTTALRRLGFQATNGGNATPAPATVLSYAPGSASAVGVVAQVVKAGREVARHPRPGLARASVVLTLGNDFRGVAPAVEQHPTTIRPPKPTAATRSLPAWDPRPC